MAIKAELTGRLSQLWVGFCAVYVVAIEAGDSAAIHDALYEIVALHAIFVPVPSG